MDNIILLAVVIIVVLVTLCIICWWTTASRETHTAGVNRTGLTQTPPQPAVPAGPGVHHRRPPAGAVAVLPGAEGFCPLPE